MLLFFIFLQVVIIFLSFNRIPDGILSMGSDIGQGIKYFTTFLIVSVGLIFEPHEPAFMERVVIDLELYCLVYIFFVYPVYYSYIKLEIL